MSGIEGGSPLSNRLTTKGTAVPFVVLAVGLSSAWQPVPPWLIPLAHAVVPWCDTDDKSSKGLIYVQKLAAGEFWCNLDNVVSTI